MKPKPPFVLVPHVVSHGTIECLEMLLAQAKRGQLIGVAYVAMMRRRAYAVNVTGEAHRNPTFARGCVQVLDDELGKQIRGGE